MTIVLINFKRLTHNGSRDWSPIINGIDYSKVDPSWIRQFNKAQIPTKKFAITFSRSRGPGGQNVNKVNTKVEMRFNVESSDWMPIYVRTRFAGLNATKINSKGEFVVVSDRFRTQKQNFDDCVSKLELLIKEAAALPNMPSEEQKQRVADLIKAEKEKIVRANKMRKTKALDRQSGRNWRKDS